MSENTILCIDDDDGVLGYHRALLERRGYDVLTTDSPTQGLLIAAERPVAAVVVDYHMPEMNGDDVAAEIKRLRPHVPVIMVSSDPKIPPQNLTAVDAFVSKEDASSQLLPLVAQICGRIPKTAK